MLIRLVFVAIPGKPTGVTLVEAVKDCMVLSWTAPAKNGGADIRGYFVDYRTVKGDVVGKWHEMNHKALTTTTYKVKSFTSMIAMIHSLHFFQPKTNILIISHRLHLFFLG